MEIQTNRIVVPVHPTPYHRLYTDVMTLSTTGTRYRHVMHVGWTSFTCHGSAIRTILTAAITSLTRVVPWKLLT